MNQRPAIPSNPELDRLIAARFSVSLMSDSKWERLLDRLTEVFEGGIHIDYKLIHEDSIRSATFVTSDFGPFFLEPIVYREVEWIEFPRRYEDFVNPDNRKAGQRFYDQNLDAILAGIQQIGQFEIEQTATGLRLYAYR